MSNSTVRFLSELHVFVQRSYDINRETDLELVLFKQRLQIQGFGLLVARLTAYLISLYKTSATMAPVVQETIA